MLIVLLLDFCYLCLVNSSIFLKQNSRINYVVIFYNRVYSMIPTHTIYEYRKRGN